MKPLCEAFLSLCDEFYFVSTEDATNVGYQIADNADYVLAYFEDSQKALVRQKILDADVVVFGSCPIELIELRMANDKLSFIYSERFFKKGTWRRFIPSVRKTMKRKIVNYADKKLFVLSASAFLSYDLSLLGFPSEKCFKWGYFPKIIEYENIDKILDKKEPGAILWCGRLIGLKHPEHAIRIAKLLKEAGYKFNLDMIGDGIMRRSLEKKIEKWGLSGCVRLLGSKSSEEVRTYMEKSQIFLFTSNRMEGWGAVLNESMNAGCAVVASDSIGSVPLLIHSGKNGKVYKSGDVKGLYKNISALLDNPQKTREMGQMAYQTLISEWNAEEAAKRLLALVNSIDNGSAFAKFDSGPCSNSAIVKDGWYKKKRS